MDDRSLAQLATKLRRVADRFASLETELSQPEIAADRARFRSLAKQHADLEPLMALYTRFSKLLAQRDEAREMVRCERDSEMREFAEAALDEAEAALPGLARDIQLRLVPRDPLDDKNVILEIRAGTGGEEAALFAADLLRMYTRYAEEKGWKMELMGTNETDKGGFREVTVLIAGDRVYSALKFEGGVHRVQRVPETEASGRIHTSAATVAVLPEADEVDVEIDPNDLRIDVFRSSGPGGQSVNTTDSAVRITHLPTGLVVSQQDEKSQIKNRAKAMKVLRARLLEMELEKQASERAGERRAMVGTGDRSERIRTYNFPQNRLTDHRIGLTLYSLDRVMEGTLDELIEALTLEERAKKLAAAEAS